MEVFLSPNNIIPHKYKKSSPQKYFDDLCFDGIFMLVENNNLTLERFIIWEGENSIEHQKNCESKEMSDQNVGTNETKNVFAKNECDDTGKKKEMQWMKHCPECGTEQYYSCKKTLQRSIKHRKLCFKCMNIH